MRHNRGIKYSQGMKYKGARVYSDDKHINKKPLQRLLEGAFCCLKNQWLN